MSKLHYCDELGRLVCVKPVHTGTPVAVKTDDHTGVVQWGALVGDPCPAEAHPDGGVVAVRVTAKDDTAFKAVYTVEGWPLVVQP
ncbi:MAG: hypothetical protein OXQ29_19405 [Rhodospirillaceae bacterium]|nr:hypothetical protein [Rhodospirillaceae bacterium]